MKKKGIRIKLRKNRGKRGKERLVQKIWGKMRKVLELFKFIKMGSEVMERKRRNWEQKKVLGRLS